MTLWFSKSHRTPFDLNMCSLLLWGRADNNSLFCYFLCWEFKKKERKKSNEVSASTKTRPRFKIGAILPRLGNKFSNIVFWRLRIKRGQNLFWSSIQKQKEKGHDFSIKQPSTKVMAMKCWDHINCNTLYKILVCSLSKTASTNHQLVSQSMLKVTVFYNATARK